MLTAYSNPDKLPVLYGLL